VIILTLNIIVSILLYKTYAKIKQELSKNIMFDVSYLNLLKFTVFPLVFFSVNIIFIYFFHREWILMSFIPLLIPLSRYLKVLISTIQGKKEYNFLEKRVIPLVIREFNKKNIYVHTSDISIRVFDKVNKQTEVDVVIHMNDFNRLIKAMENVIQEELNLVLQPKGYIIKVIIKLPYKKKNSQRTLKISLINN